MSVLEHEHEIIIVIRSGESPQEKYCPRCQHSRLASEFNISKSRRDGLQNYCRDCQREYYHTVTRSKYFARSHVILRKSLEESCRKLKAQQVKPPRVKFTKEERRQRDRARQSRYIRTRRGRLTAARGYYLREIAKTTNDVRLAKLWSMLRTCEEILERTPLTPRE